MTFDLDLIVGSFFYFFGPQQAIFGVGEGSKTFLESNHVVEELSFLMLPSILTLDFDLLMGSFFTFGAHNVLFLGFG